MATPQKNTPSSCLNPRTHSLSLCSQNLPTFPPHHRGCRKLRRRKPRYNLILQIIPLRENFLHAFPNVQLKRRHHVCALQYRGQIFGGKDSTQMGLEIRVHDAEGNGEADSTAEEAELDDGTSCHGYLDERRISNSSCMAETSV